MLLGLGTPAATADPGPTPPTRTNSTNETVYMVKGYDADGDQPGVSRGARSNKAIKAMTR